MKFKLLAMATAALVLTACSSAKDDFLAQCSKEGMDTKVCECMYEGLAAKHSDSDILALINAKNEEDAKKLNPSLVSDAVSSAMSCAMSQAFGK